MSVRPSRRGEGRSGGGDFRERREETARRRDDVSSHLCVGEEWDGVGVDHVPDGSRLGLDLFFCPSFQWGILTITRRNKVGAPGGTATYFGNRKGPPKFILFWLITHPLVLILEAPDNSKSSGDGCCYFRLRICD